MEKGLARLRLRNLQKKKKRTRAAIILAILIALILLISIITSSFESGTVAITIKEGTSSSQIAQGSSWQYKSSKLNP